MSELSSSSAPEAGPCHPSSTHFRPVGCRRPRPRTATGPVLTSLHLQAAGVKLLHHDLQLGSPVCIVVGVGRHLEGHLCIQCQQLLLPCCHIIEPEVDALPWALCRPVVQGSTIFQKLSILALRLTRCDNCWTARQFTVLTLHVLWRTRTCTLLDCCVVCCNNGAWAANMEDESPFSDSSISLPACRALQGGPRVLSLLFFWSSHLHDVQVRL